MTRSILDALDAHAADRPQALALDNVSYGELRAASLRVAARLRELGVRPGDRVAIYAENRSGFVFAYLGGLRAGAIVVPVTVHPCALASLLTSGVDSRVGALTLAAPCRPRPAAGSAPGPTAPTPDR